MKMKSVSLILLSFLLVSVVSARAEVTPEPSPSFFGVQKLEEAPLLERFPDLSKFVHQEEASNLYFGFGVSPVTIVNGKFGFAASIFQLHYVKAPWDIELLNLSFGSAFGDTLEREQFFLVRSTPKFRIFKNLSVGPVVGIEFVHFPNVTAAVTKFVENRGQLFSEQFEFSTFGYFYGGGLSQTFDLDSAKGGGKAIRVSAIYYQEKYSVTESGNGWSYYFQQNELNINKDPIAPASMFMLEISYLY